MKHFTLNGKTLFEITTKTKYLQVSNDLFFTKIINHKTNFLDIHLGNCTFFADYVTKSNN